MALAIDQAGLSKKALPPIDSCKKKLSVAKEILRKVNAPDDFDNRFNIKFVAKGIENIEKQVNDTKKMVNKDIEAFSKVESLNEILVSNQGNSLNKTKNNIWQQGGILGIMQFSLEAQRETQQFQIEASRKTGASIANQGIAFGKGFGNVGEKIFDFFTIGGTAKAETELRKNAYDPMLSKYNLNAVGKDQLDEVTNQMWSETMSFVAEKHVDNVYNNFYKNNKFGRALDSAAYAPFKSDGFITQISSGLGEVTGTAVVSTFGVPAPVVAYMVGTGKSTEEYWYKAKQVGESSNWTTQNVKNGGIIYGNVIGAWEATQWGVGQGLQKLAPTASLIKNSVIRVVIDAIFNGADTPFRAATEALFTEGMTFKEAFEEQGGWSSVGVNTAIGLVGSVFGEVMDYKKDKKKNILQKKKIEDNNKCEIEDEAVAKLKSFFEEKEKKSGILYVSDEKLELLKDKIHILTKEEFYEEHLKFLDGKFSIGLSGFNGGGQIFILDDPSIIKLKKETIMHEINHSLGGINESRGINEAFTELLTIIESQSKFSGSDYDQNSKILKKIIDIFEKQGYEDIGLASYYIGFFQNGIEHTVPTSTGVVKYHTNIETHRGDDLFKNMLDSVMGEGAFKKMADLMDIADGQCRFRKTKFFEELKAKNELTAMAKEFEKKISKSDEWKNATEIFWNEFWKNFNTRIRE